MVRGSGVGQAWAGRLAAAGLWVVLVGCANRGPAPTEDAPATGEATRPLTEGRLAQAAVAPLTDLNLLKAKIPPVLQAALKTPYGRPQRPGCEAIAGEVLALDKVLGADLDTPATASNPSLVERGSAAAEDAVVGAVRKTTEGIVPFRGWVRQLTGAERDAKEVAAAVAAGAVRRAYLKGLGQAQGCSGAAAPKP